MNDQTVDGMYPVQGGDLAIHLLRSDGVIYHIPTTFGFCIAFVGKGNTWLRMIVGGYIQERQIKSEMDIGPLKQAVTEFLKDLLLPESAAASGRGDHGD